VQGLLLAMICTTAPGQTFILSGPTSIAMRELVALIEPLVHVRLKKWFVPAELARFSGGERDCISMGKGSTPPAGCSFADHYPR